MSKVILVGSSILVLLFCFVGIFGYATFVNSPGQLCTKNILDNNYYNGVTLMQVSNFTMLFSVISSFPLVILPSKDSIEELFMSGRRLTKKQNIMITFLLVSMNCCLALFIPSIGDAMTLVGSTINPLIGFILPILFYLKQIENQPWHCKNKLFSYFVILLIIGVSGLSLFEFFTSDDLQSEDPEFC
jgi:amino acid permease